MTAATINVHPAPHPQIRIRRQPTDPARQLALMRHHPTGGDAAQAQQWPKPPAHDAGPLMAPFLDCRPQPAALLIADDLPARVTATPPNASKSCGMRSWS